MGIWKVVKYTASLGIEKTYPPEFYLAPEQCCGQYRLRFDGADAATYYSMSNAGCRLGRNVLEDESLAGDETCSTPCFESARCGVDSLFEFGVSRLGNSCEHRLSWLKHNTLNIGRWTSLYSIAYRVMNVNPFGRFAFDKFSTNEILGWRSSRTCSLPVGRYMLSNWLGQCAQCLHRSGCMKTSVQKNRLAIDSAWMHWVKAWDKCGAWCHIRATIGVS